MVLTECIVPFKEQKSLLFNSAQMMGSLPCPEDLQIISLLPNGKRGPPPARALLGRFYLRPPVDGSWEYSSSTPADHNGPDVAQGGRLCSKCWRPSHLVLYRPQTIAVRSKQAGRTDCGRLMECAPCSSIHTVAKRPPFRPSYSFWISSKGEQVAQPERQREVTKPSVTLSLRSVLTSGTIF